jgi:hypothetical protein
MFLWFLKNPLLTAAGVVIIALGLFSGIKQIQTAELHAKIASKDVEITKLGVEKQALTDSVNNLNVEIQSTKVAQKALESSINRLAERTAKSGDIQKEIDNAPKTDDAPIAPVLRRALDRM